MACESPDQSKIRNDHPIPPGGCTMCLAIPGKIVELLPENEIQKLAVVDVVGVRRRVDLGLIEDDPPVVGDWVLIHVGFAMSKISEEEAIEQMNILAILGEADAAMQEVRGYGLPEDLPDITPNPSEEFPAQSAKPS